MKRIRRKLTTAEQNAANNAKTLWLKKQHEYQIEFGKKMSQEIAANELGWQNQGVFSQYLNGKLPIGTSVLLNLSAFFNVMPDDIFPELAKKLKGNHYDIKHNGINDHPAIYNDSVNKEALEKATKFLFNHFRDVMEHKGPAWSAQMILKLYELFQDPASEKLNPTTILKLVA